MAIEVINRGTSANDGTGDNIREAFRKVNDNFDQVLTNDTTDYTDATTPLAGTEIALVEQGGTFKKVAVSEFGGGGTAKRTCVFNNRSSWTFPANVSPDPFILVGSTNYELAVANINSGTDVALTALGQLTLQPISVAPFDCIIKSFLIESRVVSNSFFNFPLRVVIGSNLVPQNPTANVVVTNNQVCEDFQVSTVNGTIYNYTNTTGGVTIPKGHGIIPLIAFQRPGFFGGSFLLTIQIEIQEI